MEHILLKFLFKPMEMFTDFRRLWMNPTCKNAVITELKFWLWKFRFDNLIGKDFNTTIYILSGLQNMFPKLNNFIILSLFMEIITLCIELQSAQWTGIFQSLFSNISPLYQTWMLCECLYKAQSTPKPHKAVISSVNS